MLVVNPATDFVKVALLVLTMFTVLVSTSGKFTDHVGEYSVADSAGERLA